MEEMDEPGPTPAFALSILAQSQVKPEPFQPFPSIQACSEINSALFPAQYKGLKWCRLGFKSDSYPTQGWRWHGGGLRFEPSRTMLDAPNNFSLTYGDTKSLFIFCSCLALVLGGTGSGWVWVLTCSTWNRLRFGFSSCWHWFILGLVSLFGLFARGVF